MPRTKINRVPANNKRARENTSEIEDILRDFDVEYEANLQKIRKSFQKAQDEADIEFENFKKVLGDKILSMTMGELAKLKSLDEIIEHEAVNAMSHTMKDVTEKTHKVDDGYLTGETSKSDKSFEAPNVSIIAPLKSLKNRRRSQSCDNLLPSHSTPGPRALMTQKKFKTPLQTRTENNVGSTHASRSKFRTPMTANRPRAASSDPIVPKCDPATPLAILRHARAGELAYSVSGSPIVASNTHELTANVNIPIANNIISLRPQNLDPALLDTSLIQKIDTGTLDHLRQLKSNLDLLMSKFERRKH